MVITDKRGLADETETGAEGSDASTTGDCSIIVVITDLYSAYLMEMYQYLPEAPPTNNGDIRQTSRASFSSDVCFINSLMHSSLTLI